MKTKLLYAVLIIWISFISFFVAYEWAWKPLRQKLRQQGVDAAMSTVVTEIQMKGQFTINTPQGRIVLVPRRISQPISGETNDEE